MSGPPDRMDIEVEETDIIKDGNTILDSMSVIREEFLLDTRLNCKLSKKSSSRNGTLIKQKADEYLHLTYRLASILEGLDNSDEPINSIKNEIQTEPALLNYDYLQNNFWKIKNPELDSSLDNLLLKIRRENLSTMKEKHHIMQATKYLLAKEQDSQDRKYTLDTLLPFLSNASELNKEFFEKELEGLKLKKLQTNAIAKVDGDKNIKELIDIIKPLGFEKLHYSTNYKKYSKDKPNLPPSKIVDLTLDQVLNEESYEEKQRFWRKNLPYFKWLTYPLLGNMPVSMQEKLEKYAGTAAFKATKASLTSAITNILPYAYTIYHTLGTIKDKIPDEQTKIVLVVPLALITVGLMLETAFRIVSTDEPGGSLIGKALSYPLEKRLNRDGTKEEKSIVVEVNLSNKEREIELDRTNYFELLEKIIQKPLSEKTEKNLKWVEQNHHSYGSKYANRILEGNRIKGCESVIDNKSETFDYFRIKEFDGYYNLSAMICKKDERFMISSVGKTKPEIHEVNEMISSDRTTEEKLKVLAEEYNSEFIRIKKYSQGTLSEDYEVLK